MESRTQKSEDWEATMESEGTTKRASIQGRERRGSVAGSQYKREGQDI